MGNRTIQHKCFDCYGKQNNATSGLKWVLIFVEEQNKHDVGTKLFQTEQQDIHASKVMENITIRRRVKNNALFAMEKTTIQCRG